MSGPLRTHSRGGGRSFLYWVHYDGKTYDIPRDKRLAGQTFEVLDVVTELMALNKSAKDLPTTNVFTLVGSP